MAGPPACSQQSGQFIFTYALIPMVRMNAMTYHMHTSHFAAKVDVMTMNILIRHGADVNAIMEPVSLK